MVAIRSFSTAGQRRNRKGTRIRRGLAASFGGLALLLSGCATATSTTATTSPPAPDAEVVSPTASVSSITSEIVGYWHRAQSCEELVPAFEAAGLAVSHRGWLQGNFYSGAEGPATGDVCAGAEGPLEHSHWFTETGEFGSHDQIHYLRPPVPTMASRSWAESTRYSCPSYLTSVPAYFE